MKRCDWCGKCVDAGVRFCPTCGKKLKTGLYTYSVLGLLIVFLIGAVAALRDSKPEASAGPQGSERAALLKANAADPNPTNPKSTKANTSHATRRGVTVYRGRSKLDGTSWVRMSVPADESYLNWMGIARRPKLDVSCWLEGEEHKFAVALDSGPLEDGGAGVPIRLKLGDGDIRRTLWRVTADPSRYVYDSDLDEHLTDEQERRSVFDDGFAKAMEKARTESFLYQLLEAKTLLMELQPFMSSGLVEARFDLRGLAEEFDKQPECALPPSGEQGR